MGALKNLDIFGLDHSASIIRQVAFPIVVNYLRRWQSVFRTRASKKFEIRVETTARSFASKETLKPAKMSRREISKSLNSR